MMNKKIHFLCFFCGLFIIGCLQPEITVSIDDERFPLKQFIQDEVDQITGKTIQIEKSIMQNGQLETTTQSNEAWIDMLHYFGKSGFNKPSSSGQFLIDSVITENLKTITYIASSDQISPKQVEINYRNNRITDISYRLFEKNMLFEKNETRTYLVDSLIRIEQNQKIRFLPENQTMIESRIISSSN